MKSFVRIMLVSVICLLALPGKSFAQVDEDDLGAWYMYFFNAPLKDSQWGFQGDVQYRNWDLGGDLEQLLLRGGVTWRPKSNNAMFTLGYGNITSGEFGPGDDTSHEERTYLEALLPQSIGERVHLRHRFRFEQRWVNGQDFRTRWRYALFMDVPINNTTVKRDTWYFAFYNELFINGQRDIGDGRSVETFDRNRLYGAIGFALRDRLRLQFGYMHQYTNAVKKGQLQLSVHQTF